MSDPQARDDAERQAILQQALRHAAFDGWTGAMLARAAEDADLTAADARRLFPRGPRDLLAFCAEHFDRRMTAALADLDLPNRKVRERVNLGVRTRLELMAPHREALRRALAVRLLPPPHVDPWRALARTVDLIWHAAGDSATDFNYYTKRALLAGVYGSTLLYWLQDDSKDFADTWAFLDRRIGDVMRIQTAKPKGPRLGERIERTLRRLGRLRYRAA